MRDLPEITGRGEWDTVIVRTDYGDAAAWRALAADLARPWGDDGREYADEAAAARGGVYRSF